MSCIRTHQEDGYVATGVQREMCMATLPLADLAQASMATNHRTHLASWALTSRAWYPYATAVHLAQGIFLLMLIIFLGVRVLVSRGFLVHLPPSLCSRFASRLVLARSATPSCPRYRQLGLQFTVEENLSTGHGRFLHSLLSLEAD